MEGTVLAFDTRLAKQKQKRNSKNADWANVSFDFELDFEPPPYKY